MVIIYFVFCVYTPCIQPIYTVYMYQIQNAYTLLLHDSALISVVIPHNLMKLE